MADHPDGILTLPRTLFLGPGGSAIHDTSSSQASDFCCILSKKSRKIDVMDTHAVNCAVVAGQSNLKERVLDLNYGLSYGTAFCLAPNLFLTAAHVFQSAQSDGEVTVFRLTPGSFHGVTVQDSEVFADIDLALLHCPGLQAEILPFNFTPLGFLDDVFAMGFPFGLEPPTFHLRAFKGYIVNRRGLTASPDTAPAYELSLYLVAFRAPLASQCQCFKPIGGAGDRRIIPHRLPCARKGLT